MFGKKPAWHQNFEQKRVSHAGRSFASKGEAGLFDFLLLERGAANECDIKCQPHVFLTEARIEMIPDFFTINDGVYDEYKGFETPVYRIKRKLWTVYGPGPLRVYKGYGLRMTLVEEIIPRG